MKATFIVAAFIAVFSASPVFAAPNLVVNGGFETGDFSGWDQFGDQSYTAVYPGWVYPVDDGQYSAAFGPGLGLGGITQIIDTRPGQIYYASFDLANLDVEGSNQFIFSIDDGFQLAGDTLDPFGFQTFTVPVIASGLSADISFFFENPSAYFLLDDVSVVAVPEPASWSLLLMGFAAIGAAMRRRKPITARIDGLRLQQS